MPAPQNLPEMLQARLQLGLFNWVKRTATWTLVLGGVSLLAPGLKFLLIGWWLFSGLSLAAILLGMKFASKLKSGVGAGTVGGGVGEPRVVGGTRPAAAAEEDFPTASGHHRPHGHQGHAAADDEIIEIEAEVLPPEGRQ